MSTAVLWMVVVQRHQRRSGDTSDFCGGELLGCGDDGEARAPEENDSEHHVGGDMESIIEQTEWPKTNYKGSEARSTGEG